MVRPFDNPLRVFVASASRAGEEHLVELDAYDGVGKCMCEDFTFRLAPLLDRGDRSHELRCRHIVEAREWLAQKIHLDSATNSLHI